MSNVQKRSNQHACAKNCNFKKLILLLDLESRHHKLQHAVFCLQPVPPGSSQLIGFLLLRLRSGRALELGQKAPKDLALHRSRPCRVA